MPARVPDHLHADPREQEQRQQRVQHQPRELLARPRVDDQRHHEAPDQEQAQQRRAPQRVHGADRAEQQRRPLHAEQHDEVEAPRLAAAADLVLAEPVVEPRVEAAHAVGVGEEGREEQRVDAEEGGERPAPRLEADGADRVDQLSAPRRDQHEHEEREGHEARDERGLLDGEAGRQQGADQRRLVALRPVEEAEGDDHQREGDGREVDVLAREAREVQVRRAEGERRGGREGADPAELAAQQVGEGHHQRAHQHRGEPGREVAVAEDREDGRRQVEAQRPVQQRVVLVAAVLEEGPREVGVLALVVVEGPVAEVVEAQRERHEDEHAVGDQLAARATRRALHHEPRHPQASEPAVAGGEQHEPDDRDRDDDDEAQHHDVGDGLGAGAAERLDAEDRRRVLGARVGRPGRHEREDRGERDDVEPLDRVHAEADGCRRRHPHAGLDRPDQHREPEQQQPVVRAPQAQRGRDDRGQEGPHPLVAADREVRGDAGDGEAGEHQQDDLDAVGADLAQQPVADDHEDRDQHGDVEQPLGEQRADHGADRGAGARRHQDRADRVARARGQHVVAHVAHAGERVGVDARGLGALVDQQPLPALRAHEGGQRVERDRPDQGGQLGPAGGQVGRLLLGRPPDDAGEGEQGHGQAEPGQARADPPPAAGRRVGH